MFAKKLLSIVGLLFIGSRITSVNATGIDSCSTASVTITGCDPQVGPATGACIDGNKIYTYAEDTKSTCYVSVESPLAAGVHVLTVSGATVTDVELSAVDSTADTNYLLYICDDSKCDITNGFVKGKNDAYIKIISGETAGEDASTSLDDSDKADCTPGTIFKGKDEDSAIKFCIAAGQGEALAANAAATKNYIVTKSEPLTADKTEAKTDMVVQVSDKAFVLNTIYTDDEYCVYGTNEIQNRIANFCEGTILDNMYTCENGLCFKRDSPITAGNYIVKSGTDFNLYKCETDTGSTTVTCNVDNGAEDNGILLVKEESNTKEYTFQKVYATSLLSTADLATDSLFIYDCVAGACKPAEALIRAGTTTATAYCDGTDKCATGTETITLAKIGAISYDTKFIMTPTGSTAVDIESGKSYAYVGTDSAFAVIKNVGNVIVAKAQILDDTIYVKGDNTLATFADYTACGSTIKQYTSVNTSTNTATAGSDCVPPAVECELSVNGDENEHCVEGYYLKSTDDGNNKDKLVKTDKETGTLYYCEGTKKACTSELSSGFKPGFYKNVDVISKGTVQYIKCSTLATCTAVAVTDTACSAAKVGGLITDEGDTPKISICIDEASNAVELSDGEVKVFISIDTEDGKGADAFGTKTANSFVLLDIGVNCLKNDSDELPYRYSGPNQVLVRRTDNARGDICKNQGAMKEFKKGDDHIYTN